MKKILMSVMTLSLAIAALTSCSTMQMPGATGNNAGNNSGSVIGSLLGGGSNTGNSGNSNASNSQGLLGSLISGLISNAVPVSYQALQGTWHYSSPECRFESENALAQAGGEVAASTVEGKLADLYSKVGIRKGSCSFTFNADKTCSITFGNHTINGTYTLNPDTRDINIVSNTGLFKLNGKVYYSVANLSILFDANKLLSLAQGISAITGQYNQTAGIVSGIVGNYKGMQLGVNLTK